jgi:murein DD-endopeptidase MepM/ murein hydrolase activator NlpD
LQPEIAFTSMPKVKYYFNTHSLKYEKVVVSIWKRVFRVLAFLVTAGVFAAATIAIAYSYFDSPKEKQLKREIGQMKLEYELLSQRMQQVSAVVENLQERDKDIYRAIFEAEPVPASVWEAGFGGVNKYESLGGYEHSEMVIETSKQIDKLSRKVYLQSKSFDEIFNLVKNKTDMLASIPAIQPISGKNLQHVASGYGYRIHPIYKTLKMHTGIDFTASTGTPIYATGNGTIASVEKEYRGYGHNVVISHGYGYQTLYGHMSRITIKPGQKVKRGDIIGYVGNTGTSTGPHLHYEVIKHGKKINPVNFFYNDLSPEEYEKMIQVSSSINQSLDY